MVTRFMDPKMAIQNETSMSIVQNEDIACLQADLSDYDEETHSVMENTSEFGWSVD